MRDHRSILICVALWASSPAFAGSVVVDGARYQAMRPLVDPRVPTASMVLVRQRSVSVRQEDETLFVSVRWRLEAPTPGWADVQLTGPMVQVDSVRWNGAETAVTAGPEGALLSVWVAGPSEIVLEGTVDANLDVASVDLELLDAPIGDVIISGTGGQPSLLSAAAAVFLEKGHWSTGAPRFQLGTTAPSAGVAATLVIAHVGMGLTLGDSEIRGNARMEWEVRRGSIDRVSFSVANVGKDLDVKGEDVESWRRSGDTVEVDLRDRKSVV